MAAKLCNNYVAMVAVKGKLSCGVSRKFLHIYLILHLAYVEYTFDIHVGILNIPFQLWFTYKLLFNISENNARLTYSLGKTREMEISKWRFCVCAFAFRLSFLCFFLQLANFTPITSWGQVSNIFIGQCFELSYGKLGVCSELHF